MPAISECSCLPNNFNFPAITLGCFLKHTLVVAVKVNACMYYDHNQCVQCEHSIHISSSKCILLRWQNYMHVICLKLTHVPMSDGKQVWSGGATSGPFSREPFLATHWSPWKCSESGSPKFAFMPADINTCVCLEYVACMWSYPRTCMHLDYDMCMLCSHYMHRLWS